MKNFILILFISAMLTACEKDQVDMDAFVADAQRGVWMIDDYDITYTNGETLNGKGFDGASNIHSMMLFPDGTCRIFMAVNFLPAIPILYQEIQWSPLDNGLGFYSAQIEEDAKTANYAQYAAQTTLELLYYKDGAFIMKGMQPFAYWGGMTSQGIYKDYCTVVGHIATDRATVDKYLSYKSYEQYKEEHPELFL